MRKTVDMLRRRHPCLDGLPNEVCLNTRLTKATVILSGGSSPTIDEKGREEKRNHKQLGDITHPSSDDSEG